MSNATDMVRKMFAAGDAARDEGLSTPEDIIRFDNIQYGSDPVWNLLDVYRPAGHNNEKLPVVVSYHGGGWSYGDKEAYQFYCMDLAKRGFAVVNYTYRLNPEFQFPAPLEDCNSVFTWVMSHADEYMLDTDRIFGVGDSAGGQGMGLYAAIVTDPAFAALFDFKVPAGLELRAIALNCGCYKIDFTEDAGQLDLDLMQTYLPQGGSPRELWMINVMAHVTADYPPTFVMTCTGDFLRDLAPLLANRLTEKEVPFEFRFYGDKNNVLGHVFHLDIRKKESRVCTDDECEFFRHFM